MLDKRDQPHESNSLKRANQWLRRNKKKLFRQLVIVLPLAGIFSWLGATNAEQCLPWACFAIWVFAELSSMPPMFRADKRQCLLPGENALPFVQSFVLGLARANYFFGVDAVPIDLSLGILIALSTSTYCAMIAVRLGQGSSGRRLLTWVWVGAIAPAVIRCFFSLEVAGTYYVGVVFLNRSSMWAGIVQAIRAREGRYFCDLNMVLFNLASSVLWLYYAIVLNNFFLLVNQLVAILFLAPCLFLKVLLHPKCFGRHDISDGLAASDKIRKADSSLDRQLGNDASSWPLPLGASDYSSPLPQRGSAADSKTDGSSRLEDENSPIKSPGTLSRQFSRQVSNITSLVGESVTNTLSDDGAFETPGAAFSTIASIVGGAVTGVIVEAFEGTFEGVAPLSTGSGFGGPVQVPCEDDQASLMSAAPMLATISEMPSDLEAGEAGLVVPSASSSVSTASPLRSPSQGEVEGAPSSSPLRLPSQGSIEEIPDGLQQKDSNVEANEPDISGSDL